MVLDEAAHIAPLPELDGLAATCASHGIQLVTVWQDLAQVRARYGARAPTVLNNHRAKLFLPGIADPDTLDYASRLIGDEEVTQPSVTRDPRGARSTTRPPAAAASAARRAALPAAGAGGPGLRHPATGPAATPTLVGDVEILPVQQARQSVVVVVFEARHAAARERQSSAFGVVPGTCGCVVELDRRLLVSSQPVQ